MSDSYTDSQTDWLREMRYKFLDCIAILGNFLSFSSQIKAKSETQGEEEEEGRVCQGRVKQERVVKKK